MMMMISITTVSSYIFTCVNVQISCRAGLYITSDMLLHSAHGGMHVC